MCLYTFKTRECSCQGFQHIPIHDTQRGWKKKSHSVLNTPPRLPNHYTNGPLRMALLRGTCMAGLQRRRGPHNHPQSSRQDQLQSASGSTWLCLSPILSGTSCGLSVASVEPNDAAAINMRQRVWVSDSCTVDQGHTVLALSGRATPKKANPLWDH